MSFAQGMQMGLSAFQGGVQQAAADRRQTFDENRQTAADARQSRLDSEAQLDRELERKNKEKMGEKLGMELQMQKDDMQRFAQASDAFDKFKSAESLIDWSNPTAPDQYDAVKRSYLPDIMKHDSQFQKYQSLDKVNSQRDALLTGESIKKSTSDALRTASQIAPELVWELSQKRITPSEFASKLRIRQQEIADQALDLRRAPYDARLEAEAMGVYGGLSPDRSRKIELLPGAKAELSVLEDEMKRINKELAAINGVAFAKEGSSMSKDTPISDKKLNLLNQKSKLQRQIRAFDAQFTRPSIQPAPVRSTSRQPQPAAAAPVPNTSNAFKVGDFTVTPLE